MATFVELWPCGHAEVKIARRFEILGAAERNFRNLFFLNVDHLLDFSDHISCFVAHFNDEHRLDL